MISVIEAHYEGQYKISLTFNDRKTGVLDLQELLAQDPRHIFKELLDLRQFKKFRVAADTVVWDNGLDLAPEFLYQQVK